VNSELIHLRSWAPAPAPLEVPIKHFRPGPIERIFRRADSPDQTRSPIVRNPIARPLFLTIVFSVVSLGTPAAAFDGPSLEARGALGVGSMLSSPQREQGFRTGYVPDLHPGLRVSDTFVAELAAASWFFPRDSGTGRATMFGAGLRFDPRLTSWLTWFLDGHGGLALTGGANRFMVDAGTGLDVWIMRNLALGPFVRYGQVMDGGPDPRFWAAGLGATMTWAAGTDEPPSLGERDPDREARQREWERDRRDGTLRSTHKDRDGDGVVDDRDICPDEPPGSNPDPNMAGCPRQVSNRSASSSEPDRDGDGVPDKDDKCPRTPFGNTPDPLAFGCPLADKDRDGVPDLTDACPNQAGSTNAKGCPAGSGGSGGSGRSSGLARIDRGMIQLPRSINFNQEEILSGSISLLQAVADLIKATPGIKSVSIEAHTDSSLAPLQSLELSEKRAENVKRWLVAAGVDSDRLRVRGHGDTQPVASNRTVKGRAANSRIELIIVDPPGGVGL